MTKAIRIYHNGGPEVLKWEAHEPGRPGKNEVLIRHEAIGLNFIDVYHRTGLYPLPSLPAIPGMEAAGIVETVGEGVTDFKHGDRVAYAGLPPGAYTQVRLIPGHRLVKIPDGRGVAAVYDSVGQATFMKSLDCLKTFGMMVSFGQASGSVPPFDPGILAAKGSLFLTRPSLMTYTEKREDLLAHAKDLFDAVEKGAVTINIGQEFPLSEAAVAHRHLEGRKTTGSTILIP